MKRLLFYKELNKIFYKELNKIFYKIFIKYIR